MINPYKKQAGTLALTKGDKQMFELTKIRLDANCYMCNKIIKKGCFCLGGGCIKYCLDCSPLMLNNAVKSMRYYIQVFNNTKHLLKKNKEEYTRNNLVNSL